MKIRRELSVFRKDILNKFNGETIQDSDLSESISAINKVNREEYFIRNTEDSIVCHALNGHGLSVWSNDFNPLKSKSVDFFKPFIEDYRLVPEDQRLKRLAVFDTETTGRFNSYIVSIAICILNLETMQIEDEYYQVINPLAEIEDGAFRVHKISQEEAEKNPTFKEVEEKATEMFLKADAICGQNIEGFDLRVLEREYERLDVINPLLSLPTFDTMVMAKHIVQAKDKRGKLKNPTVEESMNFFKIEQPEGMYHNALTDTKSCVELVKRLFNYQFEDEDVA